MRGGEAAGLETAELGERGLEGAVLGGLQAVEALEAGFGFEAKEGVGLGLVELLFPLEETAELPGGGEEVGEELVFQSRLGTDGAEEFVAEFVEGGLIGFGDLDGGAVKGAFELDDCRRRGRDALALVFVTAMITAFAAHASTPKTTVTRRVKCFGCFGGGKCKNIGDFILKPVVNGF